MANQELATLTIPSGQTTSNLFDAQGLVGFAIQLPAAMTGTSLTVEVSLDEGQTWGQLYKVDGTTALATIPFNANRRVVLADELARAGAIRFVSSATEAAARTIKIIGKDVR